MLGLRHLLTARVPSALPSRLLQMKQMLHAGAQRLDAPRIPKPRHMLEHVRRVESGETTQLPTPETQSVYRAAAKGPKGPEPVRNPRLAAAKLAFNYIQQVPRRPSRRLHYEVRIRLTRWGRRNNVVHGVVVALNKKARDGRYIEVLGSYNPTPPRTPDAANVVAPVNAELNVERIKYWLGIGARPTPRVAWLFAKAGVIPADPASRNRAGAVSFADRSTWDVTIRDPATGSVLAVVPNAVARADPTLWARLQPELAQLDDYSVSQSVS